MTLRSYIPIGAALVILGLGGSGYSCSQSGLFDQEPALVEGIDDTAAVAITGATSVISGLFLAAGLGMVGFAAGTTWRTKGQPDKADDPEVDRLPL